jgi:hypothetical protein
MTVAGGSPQGPVLTQCRYNKANGEIRSPFYCSIVILQCSLPGTVIPVGPKKSSKIVELFFRSIIIFITKAV